MRSLISFKLISQLLYKELETSCITMQYLQNLKMHLNDNYDMYLDISRITISDIIDANPTAFEANDDYSMIRINKPVMECFNDIELLEAKDNGYAYNKLVQILHMFNAI